MIASPEGSVEPVAYASSRSAASPGAPAVELRQLSKSFGTIQAVDGVTLALDRGELFFSRNPAAAQALAKKLIAYSIEQAQAVQGIDQADAERRIRASVTIKGNAVVTWGVEHPKNASRRALAVCLR